MPYEARGASARGGKSCCPISISKLIKTDTKSFRPVIKSKTENINVKIQNLTPPRVHRAATKVDGTFTLREQGEAYTRVFAGKNAVLRLYNSPFYE